MKRFRFVAMLLSFMIAAGVPNIDAMAATTGVVTGNGVNVRAGAGKDSEKIGSLSGNEEVTILDEENGWYKIEFEGKTGYVSADYVDKQDEALTGTDVDADTADGEEAEADDVDEEEVHLINPAIKTIGIILLIALLLLIIIVSTIISIRRLSEDDDYDDYDDYEDEYEDDEYEDDEYEDDEYEDDEYEEDDYDDGYGDDYEDRYREPVRRRTTKPVTPAPEIRQKQACQKPKYGEGADPARYMSNNPDDYRIDIDPKFFETSTLPKLSDDDAPTPVGKSKDSGRDAEIEAAMKKMEDLQKEIERLKQN